MYVVGHVETDTMKNTMHKHKNPIKYFLLVVLNKFKNT